MNASSSTTPRPHGDYGVDARRFAAGASYLSPLHSPSRAFAPNRLAARAPSEFASRFGGTPIPLLSFLLTMLGAVAALAASRDVPVTTLAVSRESGSTNGFRAVDPKLSGVTFTNLLPVSRFTTNQIYLNGSGVCAGDVDGDGRTDLFFAGLGGGSTLYRNLGEWRFEDVGKRSGIADLLRPLDATGAVFADTDGDGDLDLVVNSTGGGTHILFNDGRGLFAAGPVLNPGRGGTSLALADLDGDGDLDLYVANYRTETLRDQPRTNFRIAKTNDQFVVALVNGRPTTDPSLEGRFTYVASGAIVENGEPDAVFLNQGSAGFRPVGLGDALFLDAAGRPLDRPLYDWGLSVMIRDLDGDGRPDIYVCNDFASADRFWIQDGSGKFRAAPDLALRNTSKFSMGVDAADIDRDGHDDLYVLDMMSRDHATRLTRMDALMEGRPIGDSARRPQLARSTLHRNRGDGTFAEVAQFAGLEASEWAWTPLFVDVDLDGFEDLLVATGHARDDMHVDYGSRIEAMRKSTRMSPTEELALRRSTPPIATPGLAYRNLGNCRFAEMPGGWGWGDRVGVSQGACLADLDNDGDLDVAVNRLNDVAGLYRNLATAPRIVVRLKGMSPNTRGIGARIVVRGGPTGRQSQEMIAGGRYLSGDDALRVFAAPEGPSSLEVLWRGGRRSVVDPVLPDRIYVVDESAASAAPAPTPPARPASIFEDASDRLGHRHYEAPFDDFERQPLLPRRSSQAGPGIAWIDLDGNGRDDLFVGAGRGGRPGLYLGSGGGRFQLVEPNPAPVDQTSAVGVRLESGDARVLVGASAYENPEGRGAGLLAYDRGGAANAVLPLGADTLGPLAVADFDADGDLDLFVGGGPVGGRYPEPSPSRLYERIGTEWRLAAEPDPALLAPGLVSGAVWTDLDADGFPELVLACEWGPVRIFANTRGKLREATAEWGTAARTGWWTGVASADFDGDGRLDLAVGNWGLNSRYRPTPEHPIRLYYGDLAGQGQVELIEASHVPELGGWAPERDLDLMSRQLPWLRALFPTHAAYARSTVEACLADRAASPRVLNATTLASVVLLNRGHAFEVVPLPDEAQYAPVFGINAADFDLDGHVDLFLAQNFFPVSTAVSGQDAGLGLLLLGDGRGRFRPQSAERSGIRIFGEQRGSAVADFDGDGRPDLAVAQNGAETRLLRNRAPNEGLAIRVRMDGPNPDGIGVVVRPIDPARPAAAGPAQELRAGSGYRSQDSPTLYLPRPRGPLAVEVRRPGGATHRIDIPDAATSAQTILRLPAARP